MDLGWTQDALRTDSERTQESVLRVFYAPVLDHAVDPFPVSHVSVITSVSIRFLRRAASQGFRAAKGRKERKGSPLCSLRTLAAIVVLIVGNSSLMAR